ncbi:MAG: cytochrome c [Deltaproteobacteria bacterium]|nr:cytochrome c [Deltaproteobacteria bacterium]
MKNGLKWLVSLVSVCSLLGLAGAYMVEKQPPPKSAHDHMEGTQHGHIEAPEGVEKRVNPVPFEAESVSRGEGHFSKNCVSCHGASAKGDGPMADKLPHRPADLIRAIVEEPVGKLAWIVSNGYGHMPAWKGVLSERDIWDVLNFLKMKEQLSR